VKSSAEKSACWLVKSDPDTYGWKELVRDKKTDWTGVRNFTARNNLKAMARGDRVLFYESGGPKSVVGLAEVTKTSFPDPTADEAVWLAVELKATEPLKTPVTLEAIKKDPALASMALVRYSRLSVQPVTSAEFERVLAMGT
jgi:predicted RNA-binding protein with PUA-like domain